MAPKASLPQHIRQRIEENEKILAEGGKGTPPLAPASAAPGPASTEILNPPIETTPPPASKVEPAINPITPEPPAPQGTVTPEELLKRTQEGLRIANGRASEAQKELNALKKDIQEIATLQTENAQLKVAITGLERQVTELKTTVTPKKIEEESEDAKAVAEELGIDANSLARLSKVILAGIPKAPIPEPEPKPSVAPAKPAESAPKTHVNDEAYMAYVEMLDTLVGGEGARKAIVQDPKFSEFLEMMDGGTKRVIRDIAEDANKARDAISMSEIYRAFNQWKNAVTDTNKKPSHLMPSSKSGPDDLKTNKKPIYSQTQVDDFHRKVKSGYFRTIGMTADEAKRRADEYKATSDEFASARTEGRIQG